MSLLGKHLLRSVKRSPLQPLLILLTVIFSVATAIAAIRIPAVFAQHAEEQRLERMAVGDLLISVGADSDARMLFCEDAEAVVGKDGDVFGEFRLTGFTEWNGSHGILNVSAVDLPRADAFYGFRYTEYGHFDTQNLKSSAVISEDLSKKYDLHVGDQLTFRVMEAEFSFAVQAVAKSDGLLAESDVLIPMERFLSVLAERVPSVASMGESFRPYTRLMVKLRDVSLAGSVAERLDASEFFSDKNVENATSQEQFSLYTLMQTVSLWVPAILLLALSVFLVFSSMKLMQLERRDDHALFCAVGMTPRQMAFLQLTECIGYALVGSVGGGLLSVPVVRGASLLFAWQNEPLDPDLVSVLVGCLWAPVLMMGCGLAQLRQQGKLSLAERLEGSELEKPREGNRTRLPSLCLLLLLAVAVLIAVILPARQKYIPAIAVLVLLILLIAQVTPLLLRTIAGLAEKVLSRKKRFRAALFMGIKSLKNSTSLLHVGRLLTLLLTFLLSLSLVVGKLTEQTELIQSFITADVVGVRADGQTEDQLRGHPAVEAVSRIAVFDGVELSNGAMIFGVSVGEDAEHFLNEAVLPKQLPVGNEVAVGLGISRMMGARAGDEVTFKIGGTAHTCRVTEVMQTNLPVVFFDSDFLELSDELLCVKGGNGTGDDRDAREQITAIFEENGCQTVAPELLFGATPDTMNGFLDVLKWSMVAATVIALAGSLNVWAEQYRRRARERNILRENGLTRGGLIRTQLLEACLLFCFSLLLSLPFAAAICAVIDLGAASFGIVFLV